MLFHYQLTPDSDYIIDTLPKYSNIVVAAGFSGIMSSITSTGALLYDYSHIPFVRI